MTAAVIGAGLAEIVIDAGVTVTFLGLEMLLAAVTVTVAATADGEDFGFSDGLEPEAIADTTAGLIFLGILGGWTKVPSGLSFFGLPNGFEPSSRLLGFLDAISPFGRIVTVGLGFGTRVVEGGCGGCDTTLLLLQF